MRGESGRRADDSFLHLKLLDDVGVQLALSSEAKLAKVRYPGTLLATFTAKIYSFRCDLATNLLQIGFPVS